MNPRRLSPTAAALAVLPLALVAGSAEEAAPVVRPADSTLEPVIVTATRERLSLAESPNSVNVIEAEDIARRLVRTLPEMLNETPSVFVQKTAHGQGSPFIRGFTGYRNLALIDGVRLNNATFRDGPNQYWNTIDPYSVRAVELVKGQGSVLYGGDAIGGTLNVLTARPLYAESGPLTGGRAYSRFSSAEESYTGRLEASTSEADRFGFILGVTGKEYGDLRTGGQGRNPNTGYGEWDFDAKAEVFLSRDTRLTILHQQVHQNDAWRTHSTIYGLRFRGTEAGDDQRRSLDQDRYLTYLQLEGATDGFVDHYLVGVSHQRQAEEQYRVRKAGDDRRDLSGFDVDSFGAIAQFSTDSDLGYFTYGASYYLDAVDSFRNHFAPDGSPAGRSIQGPVPDDSRYHLADAFVQDRIGLTERLDVWLGGRFTYARAEIGRAEDPVTGDPFSLDDDWTSGVGSGRFVYDLNEEETVALFGGVSQGFRAPNLSDLSRLDLARSGEIETPSPGLEPERYLSYELGLRGAAGRTSGSLAYFYTDIRDLIVGGRTGRIVDDAFEVSKFNAGNGYAHGVEFEVEQGLTEQLTLFGWLSWQDGRLDNGSVEEPLSRAMPFTAEAGIRWESAGGGLWVELLALGAEGQDDLPERDRLDTQRIPPNGTPGYVIGTLRGGWELGNGLTLTGAVENFADEAYRVHGSGINGAGRNFLLGAEWKF